MRISDSLLPELEHELATTRTCIARVPDAQLAFKPHAKSYSAHDLVAHLAEIPMWGLVTFERDEFDMQPLEGPAYERPELKTVADALVRFDELGAAMKAAISATSDDAMMAPWTLRKAGQQVMTLPRIAVYRSFILNHLVHHRGQLSVYLRMMDVSVPSIYGPSADESPF
ncbi:MAG: DinB family protein [Acidobacteria bacterium]|nr:DinB family protein [Acidobacteriota bacterium]